MGKGGGQRRSAEQRELRQRRGERAFLFDKDLSACSPRSPRLTEPPEQRG